MAQLPANPKQCRLFHGLLCDRSVCPRPLKGFLPFENTKGTTVPFVYVTLAAHVPSAAFSSFIWIHDMGRCVTIGHAPVNQNGWKPRRPCADPVRGAIWDVEQTRSHVRKSLLINTDFNMTFPISNNTPGKVWDKGNYPLLNSGNE